MTLLVEFLLKVEKVGWQSFQFQMTKSCIFFFIDNEFSLGFTLYHRVEKKSKTQKPLVTQALTF